MTSFKNIEVGQCFRLTGDKDVLMKVSPQLYIRAVRELSNGRLVCQNVGTPNIVVHPCKCAPLLRALTDEERKLIDEVIAKEGLDAEASQAFERW